MCEACGGGGAIFLDHGRSVMCRECRGLGQVEDRRRSGGSIPGMKMRSPARRVYERFGCLGVVVVLVVIWLVVMLATGSFTSDQP